MEEKKVRFGISFKLSLMLLIVALVPLLTIWFFSYQSVTKLTAEKANLGLNGTNNKLVTYVDAWIDMNERMLIQNASLAPMQSMQQYQQEPILKTITKYYDWAYLAFTVDMQGENVARSDGKELKYYGDRSYYKQVLNGQQIGRQVLIGKTSGKPAMVLSTGVFDTGGNLSGVLAQAMTLEELSEKIVNTKIGKTGFTFLVDENGLVIAHPQEDLTQSRVDLSNHQAITALENGQSEIIFTDENQEKVVAVAQKTATGYTVVSQQNYAETYQAIQAENQKAIILLVATLVVIMLSALLVSRWLSAPIRNLTEVANKYSQGQLDLKISGLDRNDEIGQLGQAIERMGTSIRLAMNRLKKKKS